MKKSKKTQAIVASIAMLAFTAASFGTATYAWFTRGTGATANGFDFSASAASGIQISTDAATWKSSVTASDFIISAGSVQEDSRIALEGMDPISTVDSVTAGLFDFYKGTYLNGSYTFVQDNANFLVFDLYFLNEGASNLTLMLTDASAVVNGDNDKNTALATRVGFVVEGSYTDPEAVVVSEEGISTYIWEPNSTERSATALNKGAVASAKYTYNGINSDNSGNPISATDAYGAIQAGAYTTAVTSTKDIAIGDSNVITVLSNSAQITKIKVFIWLEGQDVDCNNGASSGDVSVSLGFDSGADSTILADKTATAISTDTVTSVAVSGTGNIGAEYTAYIMQTVTDSNVSLNYTSVLATGSATYSASDVISIVVDNVVSTAGNYTVVVTGIFSGAIGSRTSASLTI